MSDDRRKFNKQSTTGTVPKVKYNVKYRNNTGQALYNDRDSLRSLPNNLNPDRPNRRHDSNYNRNSQHFNYETMENSADDSHINGVCGNGGVTTSGQSSSTNSRRNSSTNIPKCDNISKYPNRKQIEDRLNQIREYLQITTSLMTSMKNSDEQTFRENDVENLSVMIEDLRDSEAKLSSLLENEQQNSECIGDTQSDRRNDFDEQRNSEVPREPQKMSLQYLKQRGDSKLRDARLLQEKFAHQAAARGYSNSPNSNRMENNIPEYDLAIAELEQPPKASSADSKSDINNFNREERLINDEIEELQNQIQVLHTANEDRNKLIQLLDKRDAELRCQHMELQSKLTELQSKKSQVDHLVAALHNTPKQEDDVSCHVRKIVLMKDQLSKLKDMLDMVENSEMIMQNGTQEEQAVACELYTKAENFLNKDIEKSNAANQSHHSVLQYENAASINLDGQGKQKNQKKSEKLALRAELKAKKKELEEIMGKHKSSTSNLNHDVGTDNKSEFSCSNSMFDNVSNVDSSERYSSDDGTEDVNEYSSDVHLNHQNQPILTGVNQATSKYPSDRNNVAEYPTRHPFYYRQTEGNVGASSVDVNSMASRGSSVSAIGPLGKQNMQKQMEMIRTACDSMLSQSDAGGNVHQLRNNLTPSPIYSELRSFASPNPHSMNAVNVLNAPPQAPHETNMFFPSAPPFSDVTNYQNWLTTNTLQTQAFMLNSLNQCCQMLWLQQRELAHLRGVVAALQQDHVSPHYNNENQSTPPLIPTLNGNGVDLVQEMQPRPKINPANVNHYNSLSVDPNNVMSALNNANSTTNSDHSRNASLLGLQNVNHIWNGQALNNQVPPGNRANNYWDNFRSYSRQNLFSTKSNDGAERTNYETLPAQKVNSQQATAVPQENAPQRSCVKPCRRYTNTNIAVVPPDVLNINQNVKNDGLPLPAAPNEDRNANDSDVSSPNHSVRSNVPSRTSRRHSNVATPNIEEVQSTRRRNQANVPRNIEETTKSKTFEELRENVYREVASLISANEARPHFLIQLFRDLQLVSSDPLRLKTLQSIQVLINQSWRNSEGSEFSPNQELPSSSNEFSMQSTVWSPIPPNSVPRNATILEGLISKKGDSKETQHVFREVIPFLNENEHIIVNPQFLATFKQKILEAKSFKRLVKDTIFQKHFSNVLDDILVFYNDKLLCTIKVSLLDNVRDLLERELSFMNLIQSTDSQLQATSAEPRTMGANDDLAEADQSHVEDEDAEEEGAVGGVLESLNPTTNEEATLEIAPSSTEAESQYQLGLDQVPTRLPTKAKSRSNTPSKDGVSKRDAES